MKKIILKTVTSSRASLRNSRSDAPSPRGSLLIPLLIVCLAFLPGAQAAPAPETPDPGSVGGTFNTADGTNALRNVTTGVANAAFGWFSLLSNTDGSFNTGVGAGALVLNVGDQTTGDGLENTAVWRGGAFKQHHRLQQHSRWSAALLNGMHAGDSTAIGINALQNDDTGSNTATGFNALMSTPPASTTRPTVLVPSEPTSAEPTTRPSVI